MSNNKIGIGGDIDYLKDLDERYGREAEVKAVWEKEKKRLSAVIPPLDMQINVRKNPNKTLDDK